MKISIITVSYNDAETIGATLRAVVEQSHGDVEHIVIDGLSTDGTQDVVAEHGEHVSRIVSEPDGGIYDAMNKGLGMANGDVIGLLNADDIYDHPGVLKQVATVMEDPGVDCCYGDLEYVARDNTDKVIRYWRSRPCTQKLIYKGWYPPHPTFFVKRNVYERFGNFDLTFELAADVELMWRFLGRYRIQSQYIPSVLVRMRMGGTSNRSVMTVLRQNVWLYKALQKNGLAYSRLFPLRKLPERLMQFAKGRGSR